MNIMEWRNFLCQSEEISSRGKHVGLTLSQFYRPGKRTYPTIDTLCIWTSLAPNTVTGALKDLERAGFIVTKSYRLPNARFRGHEYTFCGVLSDCISEEISLPPSKFEGSNEGAIEPSIEAAIEPSNFEGKEEEEEEEEEEKRLHPIKMIEIWNQTIQPKISTGKVSLTDTRKKRLVKEFSAIKDWQDFCIRVAKSDFLTGKNNQNWKVTIDWVLKPANLVKVREGNYDTFKSKPATERETIHLRDLL